LPPNSFGPDFTLTDINGEEFNLHSTLDEGKTVILDLFAVWCGPCWNYAESGVLEDLQEAYPDDVVVVAVEADASTSEDIIEGGGNSIGDWTTMIDYLLMDDPSGQVANDYALAYYPTIYKICPDRMVTEVNQLTSVNAFMAEINQCSTAQYSKDAKILSYNGGPSYCGGELNDVSVTIQNYSVGATLNSCEILTIVNGDEFETTDWSGSLETYQTADVNIGDISGIPENADISFEIDWSGDMDQSNNVISPDIVGSEESSSSVTLTILTDNYPEETSWQLFDADGDVVESTNTVGQAYGQDGDYAGQAITEIEIEWNLDAGCYTFAVYDAYGDGLNSSQWGGTDGLVTLTDAASGNVFFEIWDGFSVANSAFEVGETSSISESLNKEISIFPNPFKDYTNISISSNGSQEMSLEIYNNLGKVVYNDNMVLKNGANNVKIESGELTPGLYYMNAIINGESHLKPLTIIK